MKTVSPDTQKLLAIKYLKGIGEKTISSLHAIKNFSELSIEDILRLSLNKKNSYSSSDILQAMELAQQQSDIAHDKGHFIISFFDDVYPLNLKNANYAAPILFCSGDINCLKKDNLTVIGTREPTEHGIVIAKRVTEWFVRKGWSIVSGLAFGIDSIAHSTCIDSGGKTIAVLAHGLEKVYPAKNKELAKRIVDNGGLLISEYPYNSFVGKSNFVDRDAIQAAVSSGVILIQTGLSGGSLHASRASLLLNRPLIVAGQSKTDIKNAEQKACGNIALLSSNYDDVKKILRLNRFEQNLLLPLHDSKQYEVINSKLLELLKDFKGSNDLINKNIGLDF
ncbi:DNA-processing protein DprA [Enterobacter hormaechei]|uniref:DNA-processing protein DprA n=1 Tax=Enterobacter hormaechei TaxID=158836 RepID=UPI001C1B4FC7|nr:DNA-processing protein DprA [Enterobacter hormaechei]HAV1960697.1 DNA-processing protein DprA [Enterobacter hormaechei subsp. xiangfangensis]MCE1326944.1 DNA-protecting protein DprA [Enterobacter hormaechei]MCM7677317.1 DNA-protecting protein DprA [Enterobacter hormaechei]MCM8169924.1 DNA-protecting protein DprA [Enterobacter hormaechei]MDV5364524.1 DNA-processing protein DprA [Enterobacter hormaechei]